MKGKATITLCDAASGRVVKRVEEHNMVTGALNSIFNPTEFAVLGGINFVDSLNGFLPMSKSLIGGLVLLGNKVAENAEDFMLKPDNPLIGHAGDAYSGTEETRGTLNENESYALENGYHFTWDFPTDKANGVIRCCCLTNKHFGNSGRALENADGVILVNPNNPTSTILSFLNALTSQPGQFVGMFEKGILTFMSISGGELIRTRVKLIDTGSICINDVVGGVVIDEEPMNVPFVPNSIMVYFVNTSQRQIYYFRAIQDTVSGFTTISYFGVDPVTGEVTQYSDITLEGFVSFQGAAVFGNKFYCFSNSELSVFSGGTISKTYNFTGTRFYMYGDTLCVMGKMNNIQCVMCFTEDGEVCMRNHGYIPVESSFIPLPYTLHTQGAATTNSAHIMMFTNYLATINNLSEPIEKTSAQTLKVSYDITNT